VLDTGGAAGEDLGSPVVHVPVSSSSHPESPAVLVTGGAGFIGSRLVRQLLEQRLPWRVMVVDDLSTGRAERVDPRADFARADVSHPGVLSELVQRHGPFDRIVHLAGRVGVRRVLADPEGCRSLQEAAAREVERAVASQPQGFRPRVLAASTSEVYSDSREALSEESTLRQTGGSGRWAYAGSKLAGEMILDGDGSLWGKDESPIHLRFFNVVGPGQDGAGGQVLPTFVDQALAGEALTVHGDGQQVRTFGHVDDIVRALSWLLGQGSSFPGGPLNLGGTARVRIQELAERVVRLCDSSSRIQSVDPRLHSASFEEVRHREPSLERARGLGVPLASRELDSIIGDVIRERSQRRPDVARLRVS